MKPHAAREEVMRKTETLFTERSGHSFTGIEKELLALGYVLRGSDPASAEFEQRQAGLVLDVELNEDGSVHAYELLTLGQMEEKQRKFRW